MLRYSPHVVYHSRTWRRRAQSTYYMERRTRTNMTVRCDGGGPWPWSHKFPFKNKELNVSMNNKIAENGTPFCSLTAQNDQWSYITRVRASVYLSAAFSTPNGWTGERGWASECGPIATHTTSVRPKTINYHENIIFTYEMHGIGIQMAEMASENARTRYTILCGYVVRACACLPVCLLSMAEYRNSFA